MLNIPWQDLKPPKKIEAHAGTDEQLVRGSTVEEDLQVEIKAKPAHNNKSCVKLCALYY